MEDEKKSINESFILNNYHHIHNFYNIHDLNGSIFKKSYSLFKLSIYRPNKY